jgi:hypothetical protein
MRNLAAYWAVNLQQAVVVQIPLQLKNSLSMLR